MLFQLLGHKYQVGVKTGSDAGAGTDADVFIKIIGTKGTTDKHELSSSRDAFEQGQ